MTEPAEPQPEVTEADVTRFASEEDADPQSLAGEEVEYDLGVEENGEGA